MEKLKITQQSLGRLTTTSINLDIDTFLKIEKASIITGRKKSEIVAEMVNFALKYTEINGSKMRCDFGLNVKLEKPPNDTEIPAPPSPQPSGKMYVSIREASKITGLSEWFIRKNVTDGNIKSFRSGNKFLFSMKSLEEFINALEVGDL